MPRGRPRYPGPLTPREWEVLRLIEKGLTNEEIAARLGISFSGARYHVSEIISKLGVSGRKEAVAWAREQAEQPAGKRRWSLPALGIPSVRLGSPFRMAGVAAGVTVCALVLGALVLWFNGGDGGSDQGALPLEAAVDGRSAEEFFRSVQPMAPLAPGQVLYTRVETYERHGPKSDVIAAANGIPVENYVAESWMEVGPDNSLSRGYTRVTDPDGHPILATVWEGGVSRTYDVQSGSLFRQDETPLEVAFFGDPAERTQRYIEALQSGEIEEVSQTASELIVESVHDEAYYERVFITEMETRRPFTEEQKQSTRDCFFQKCMTGDREFAVPFYGDLNASVVTIRMVFDETGTQTAQEMSIVTESGERIVVQSSRSELEIVDAIPQEVIDLAR